jgi:chitinase
MKSVRTCLVALLVSVCVFQSRPAAAGPWVAGFYAGWSSDVYPPSAIDFNALTHVMVFSVLPRTDGTLDTSLFIDSVNGPLVAKDVAQRAHAAGKKAILTVGGSDTEFQFQGATSAASMNAFVQNLVNTVRTWGFDGIDIDWEPILPSDYSAMLALVNNLRAANPAMVITADVAWLNANFPLSTGDALFYAQLGAAVDQMNIMSYGMADNWGGWVSWHSSALYGEGGNHPSSVSSSARMYVNAGVPASKLGIGIGFYGSCWNSPANAPLQALGTAHVVADDNTMTFAAIKNSYYTAARYHYDATAEAPYLSFSTPTGASQCTFVSYEDETSVAAKAQYVIQSGLGGTIIWQLAEGYNPAAPDPSSLLHAIGRAFLNTAGGASSTRVQAIGGSGQSALVTTPFASALQLQVVDATGAGMSGIAVTFTAPPTGATAAFNGSTSVVVPTDASGIAMSPIPVANSLAGAYTVSATIAGVSTPVAFTLTNKAQNPSAIAAISGTPQSTVIGTTFAQQLMARVTDAAGNPMAGVTVKFSTPSGGASALFSGVHAVKVVTDANGVATAPVVTANNKAGRYSATATIAGITATTTTATTFSLSNVRRR